MLLGARFEMPLMTLAAGLLPLPLLIRRPDWRRPVVLTSLCIIFFIGGALFFRAVQPVTDSHSVRSYNDGDTVIIEGIVDRPPEEGDQTTRVQMAALSITDGTGRHEVSGNILLFLPRYPGYEYGDYLRVSGKLRTPTQIEGFDYRRYLATQEIYSTMFYPQTEWLESGRGNPVLDQIFRLREELSGSLERLLAEPQSSLARALLLGMRGDIPEDVREDFNHSGAAHLLAISGLHLTILAGILLSLGTWIFGRRHNLHIWLTLGVIWPYALLTGFQPPVARAAIMLSLFLAADLLGRQRHPYTSLVFAAALMASFNPLLLWQASFQMSFAAMSGLVFITPRLQSRADRLTANVSPGNGFLSTVTGSLSTTLGAVIAVWPLTAYYFGTFSPVAPLTTLLAMPLLPASIITGFLAAFTGLVFLPAAQAIAWLTWLCLSYVNLVVNVCGSLPLAYVGTGEVSPGLIAGYYLLLAIIIRSAYRRDLWIKVWQWLKSATVRLSGWLAGLPVKFCLLPLLLLAALIATATATLPDDRLHVSILDVGQGDAILVSHGSQQILIDGGPSPQALETELGERLPFWDRTIELVVLTHPHSDHITGLLDVLERYRVEWVLYPDLEYESDLYDEWHRLVEASGAEVTVARAGQRLDLGDGIIMDVLNPPAPLLAGTNSDADNNSVVLYMTSGEVSFLLTGDIYREAEQELIRQRAAPAADVLKVAHHGSASSTSPEFLAPVNPQIAVISAGEGNPHGHPSREVLDRLTEILGENNIYRTDINDTIEFITDGHRLWLKIYK